MAYIRTRIRLETPTEVQKFVQILNSDGSADKYILENVDSSYRVDARSYLGVLYASAEFAGEVYLANLTNSGQYPSGILPFYY